MKQRRALALVCGLGGLAIVIARWLAAPSLQHELTIARLGLGVIELGLIALVLSQLGAIRRQYRRERESHAAPIDALEAALRPTLGDVIARIMASEFTTLAYAVGSWRRATPREDAQTFSMHRATQFGAIVGVFVFLILVESVGLHLVLMSAHPVAAWLATASSLWIMMWLIGDAHALRLEPLRLLPDGLFISVGIRWRTFVPYAELADVTLTEVREETRADTLIVAVVRTVNVRIATQRPLVARGVFGRARTFSALQLSVDRPLEFVRELAARMSSFAP